MSGKEDAEDQELTEELPEEGDSQDSDSDELVAQEWVGEEDWKEEEEEELIEEAPPTFIDNGDGTVSDARANLMWLKKDSYAEFKYGITWFEALDYCEQVNEQKFAGHDDWRLASFDDAKGLFSFINNNSDKDGAEIHIDPIFEAGGGDNTWTYEEKPDYHQYAMKFSYITGNEKWEHKDNEYSHVRFVRDVSKDDWEPEWRKDSRTLER